jgi:hypothetical protein
MLHFRGKCGLDTPSAGASGYSTTFGFETVRWLVPVQPTLRRLVCVNKAAASAILFRGNRPGSSDNLCRVEWFLLLVVLPVLWQTILKEISRWFEHFLCAEGNFFRFSREWCAKMGGEKEAA